MPLNILDELARPAPACTVTPEEESALVGQASAVWDLMRESSWGKWRVIDLSTTQLKNAQGREDQVRLLPVRAIGLFVGLRARAKGLAVHGPSSSAFHLTTTEAESLRTGVTDSIERAQAIPTDSTSVLQETLAQVERAAWHHGDGYMEAGIGHLITLRAHIIEAQANA